ncbi:unnamed protein product, partial [Peniophora sp. CBMAI 1063]
RHPIDSGRSVGWLAACIGSTRNRVTCSDAERAAQTPRNGFHESSFGDVSVVVSGIATPTHIEGVSKPGSLAASLSRRLGVPCAISKQRIKRGDSRRPSRIIEGCRQYFLTEDDPLDTVFETPQKDIHYVVYTKGDPDTTIRAAKTRVGHWDPQNDIWEHVVGDIEWGGLARGDYVKSAMFERGNGYKIKAEDLLFEHPELSERVATYTPGTRFFTVGGEDFMWRVEGKGLKGTTRSTTITRRVGTEEERVLRVSVPRPATTELRITRRVGAKERAS